MHFCVSSSGMWLCPRRSLGNLTAGQIYRAAPQNVAMVTLLREDLGFGESQAIVLAIERAAVCVLMDEAEGRQRAAALGVAVVGTVGVLLRAKHDGVIPHLAPVLRVLVERHGFRLHPSVVARVLSAAGEPMEPLS